VTAESGSFTSETQATKALTANRILIVEDEALVALHTQQIVTDAGYEVVGPAFTLEEAKLMAEEEPLDGAILDIYLAGELVWPAAEILSKRGVGFLFLTGFTSKFEMPQFCKGAHRIAKPLDQVSFLSALAEISARV